MQHIVHSCCQHKGHATLKVLAIQHGKKWKDQYSIDLNCMSSFKKGLTQGVAATCVIGKSGRQTRPEICQEVWFLCMAVGTLRFDPLSAGLPRREDRPCIKQKLKKSTPNAQQAKKDVAIVKVLES